MSGIINIVLVDDEQIQLDFMETLIKKMTEKQNLVVQIDQYKNGESFLFALDEHPNWDLAFLDVEMEELSGMDVAHVIREKAPHMSVVFATAYAEYAVDGYKVQALDYLLKPIKETDIERVLNRYLHLKPQQEKIVILEIDSEFQRVPMNDIICIEASGREVTITLKNDILKIKKSLTEMTDLLDESQFIKTHRSYLVNLQHVTQLLKVDVELDNGDLIPLSRRLAKDVQGAFIDYYKETVFYDE